MDSKRQQKVSRLLQKEIAELFLLVFTNLYKGSMLTVTKVKISPDLSEAKIFLSLFGDENNEELLDRITLHTNEIRNELGKKVRHQLRIIPKLKFYIDDSLDYIQNIDDLLKT